MVSSAPLHALGIRALIDAYRTGVFSPVDVVRAYLTRIEQYDTDIRSFITVLGDEAINEARQSEAAYAAGYPRGPLDGIPVSVKDLMSVEGVPLTAGSNARTARANHDAVAVRRWRDAGAIVLGTTTLHEFAFGGTSVNTHTGTPRNPHDVRRVAGGSSGGSAASVAAGFALVSLGTETGNSIRRPAAFCGVLGLKPTYGAVSRTGVVPLAPSLDHVGLFGRSADDIVRSLSPLIGFDPSDLGSRHAPTDFLHGAHEVRGLRLGVPHALLQGIDPEVLAAFLETTTALRSAGAQIDGVDLPLASKWTAIVSSVIMHAEGATSHMQRLQSQPDSYGEDVLARLLSGIAFLGEDTVLAEAMRQAIATEIEQAMAPRSGFDAIIAPAVRDTAPILQAGAFIPGDAPWTTDVDPFHLQRLPSLVGIPAGVAPVGWSKNGLPLAIQVFGRRWEDAVVLQVMQEAMSQTSSYRRTTAAIVDDPSPRT